MGRGRPQLFGCALCRRLAKNPGKLPSDFHVSHDKDCPRWVKGMGPLAARKRKFGGGAADASPLTAKPLVEKTSQKMTKSAAAIGRGRGQGKQVGQPDRDTAARCLKRCGTAAQCPACQGKHRAHTCGQAT